MTTLCCFVTSLRSDSDLEDMYIERSELMFGSPSHWDIMPQAETGWRSGIDWGSPRSKECLLGQEANPGLNGHQRRHQMHKPGNRGITLEKTVSLVGVEGEPRLVRSAGTRRGRDWSFADPRNRDGRRNNKSWDSSSSCSQ